jgi:hypothetical protein
MRSPARRELRETRPTVVIAAAGLASGAALLAYVTTGLSLGLGLVLSDATAGVASSIAWRRLNPAMRDRVRQRISTHPRRLPRHQELIT